MSGELIRDWPPQMDWIPERQREYFPYTAQALWPGVREQQQHQPIPGMIQIDWVDALATMETWLETSIGLRYAQWVWAEHMAITAWHCGLAFHEERDRTLFLLRWG
jgi:hypothetical protein